MTPSSRSNIRVTAYREKAVSAATIPHGVCPFVHFLPPMVSPNRSPPPNIVSAHRTASRLDKL